MVKNFQRYLYSFWRDPRTWRTDRRTDGQTLRDSEDRACIASCGKNQKNMAKTIFNMADQIITPGNVARSWHWFRQVTTSCNVACDCGIMTMNSPSGSTLQCGRWLWDDMPLNSPKRPPYWNSTSGFDFDHITAVDMSFCTSLRNFIQIRPSSAEKNYVMSIFKDGGSQPSCILGVQ